MICDVCQSDRLAKNELGFLICDDCGTQSFAATQEESEFLMGESGAKQSQRVRKVKSTGVSPKANDASLSLILQAIQATLFIQCGAISNHFGVDRSVLLRAAGDIFLAYFESVRRDYAGKFQIVLSARGLRQRKSRQSLPEFKVQPFISIHMLAVALNVLREAITPLELFVEVRVGNLPTRQIPKLLPMQIASQLTPALYQFLARRSLYLSVSSLEKEMRSVYDRVSRVASVPELCPVSGNVSLTVTRYVVQLQLPVETTAPLAQALLHIHLKRCLAPTRSHVVGAVLLATKLLFGSRSPSALDPVLESQEFVPVTQLCSAPDPDSAGLAAIRTYTKRFLDVLMVSQQTQMVVGDTFDEIYRVPRTRSNWDFSDHQRPPQRYDDFSLLEEERCLCWYRDPARPSDDAQHASNELAAESGRDQCVVPEFTRLIVYDPDDRHLGHCVEHHLHRRLFQIASDIFDINHRDLDLAYRAIIESIDRRYQLTPSRRKSSISAFVGQAVRHP